MIAMMKKRVTALTILLFVFGFISRSAGTELSDLGLYVLPYPQQVTLTGEAFVFKSSLNIVLNKNHSPADEFAAHELANDLKTQWNIQAGVGNLKGAYSIVFVRKKNNSKQIKGSYQISTGKNKIIITSNDE